MVTNYDDPEMEAKLPDLEVLRLRTEVATLKKQLEEVNQILVENDLAEAKPKAISSEERVCLEQIELLAQLSGKGMPYATEDFKNLEIVVKTLLAIRGKSAPASSEDKKPKKKEQASIADLLSIVKNENK